MQKVLNFLARRWILWTLVILIGIASVGAIGFDIYRRAGGMRAATATAASVLATQPGASVKAVVRLEGAAERNTYSAELLESSDGTEYRITPSHVRIALSGDTAVVMGGAADIKPGAVVQVAGSMDGAHTVHASQIVILSGFVHLVPAQQ